MALNVLANGHFGLQSDQVTYVELEAFDAAGAPVAFPVGDVDTVSTTGTFAASLGVAIGVMPAGSVDAAGVSIAGSPAVVMTPLVLESDVTNAGGGIGISILDGSVPPLPMAPSMANMLFDIVQNLAAHSVGLVPANSATTSQPVPVAAGP